MTHRKSTLPALVLAAVLTACAGGPGEKSTGQHVDDTVIVARVKAAFVEDKQVSAANIKVDAYKGKVQLSGFADSGAEIDRAAQIARQVPGVTAVRNDIRLKQP
jgi:osmotically-inducible protein OsmY